MNALTVPIHIPKYLTEKEIEEEVRELVTTFVVDFYPRMREIIIRCPPLIYAPVVGEDRYYYFLSPSEEFVSLLCKAISGYREISESGGVTLEVTYSVYRIEPRNYEALEKIFREKQGEEFPFSYLMAVLTFADLSDKDRAEISSFYTVYGMIFRVNGGLKGRVVVNFHD